MVDASGDSLAPRARPDLTRSGRARLTPEQRREQNRRNVAAFRARQKADKEQREREAAGDLPGDDTLNIPEAPAPGTPAPLVSINVTPVVPEIDKEKAAYDAIMGILMTGVTIAAAKNPIYKRIPFPEESAKAIASQWAPIAAPYMTSAEPMWLKIFCASVSTIGLLGQWKQSCEATKHA